MKVGFPQKIGLWVLSSFRIILSLIFAGSALEKDLVILSFPVHTPYREKFLFHKSSSFPAYVFTIRRRGGKFAVGKTKQTSSKKTSILMILHGDIQSGTVAFNVAPRSRWKIVWASHFWKVVTWTWSLPVVEAYSGPYQTFKTELFT